MKYILMICTLLLFAIGAYSQTTKGLSVPKAAEANVIGKTYALIVGVSKYKNPAIPQLKYADKDAVAFRNYLVATGVDSNNIMLLLNEKATNGEFWASIGFLQDIAKKGDKVYIYFSGHGDVENKTVVKDAYLLSYDAPKSMYPAGAIAVILLKNYIGTLSASGIQAIFIADACRSGNLAGGREGMEAAGALLKENWQDEIKILSCQPGELSLESKQWGGGRGLFSYELINGMAGMADKNKDGKVTLRELTLYMMEKVPEEASPASQNPAVYGNPEATIGIVTPAVQKEILTGGPSVLAYAGTKGFDESLLMGLDDSIKYYYKMFKLALDTGNYFDVYRTVQDQQKKVIKKIVIAPCAYYYYMHIPDNNKTHSLVTLMKKNLSSTIMEDVDTTAAQFFRNITKDRFIRMRLAMPVLRDLLGNDKLKYFGFLPKLYFVESVITNVVGEKDRTLQERISMMDTAISMAPAAGYLYWWRGHLNIKDNKEEEGVADYKKAIQMSPKFSWVYPDLASFYAEKKMYDSAINVWSTLLHTDSSLQYTYWVQVAIAFAYVNNKDAAYKYISIGLNEMHSLTQKGTTDTALDFYNIACAYSVLNEKENAVSYLNKSIAGGYKNYASIERDSDLNNIRFIIEFKDLMTQYFPEEFDSTTAHYCIKKAKYYRDDEKNYLEAEKWFKKAIDADPKIAVNYISYAILFCMNNDTKNALRCIEEGCKKGYDYDGIESDSRFDNIRSTPEFKALMKKYFPNDYKE